jgi:hypothetical protein
MNKLKLVTTSIPTESDVPFIVNDDTEIIYLGERPVLAYKEGQTIHILDKGGSDRVSLVKCSDLKGILDSYMFKGTKYIASTYNPTLYYLFPGVEQNDGLFTSDNNFIPTLPVSSLVRLEVNGFSKDKDLGYSGENPPEITVENGNWYVDGVDTRRNAKGEKTPTAYKGPNENWFVSFNSSVTQSDVRCMKACDSWFNDLTMFNTLEEEINERIDKVFGYYREFNVEKEVNEDTGKYSADLSKYPLVVSLISDTTYTDTINLEDWVLASKKGTNPISGKLDISYMYSYGGEMCSGMQTIKAFQYEENVTSKNVIINFGEICPIQIEYMDYVLKIYPLVEAVDEVVFTDCTLTIGVL